HDRDRVYAAAVDDAVTNGPHGVEDAGAMPAGERVLRALIDTVRRECLDWMIVLNERHIRTVVQEWVTHYNRGRPHASLGPGIPDVPRDQLQAVRRHRT